MSLLEDIINSKDTRFHSEAKVLLVSYYMNLEKYEQAAMPGQWKKMKELLIKSFEEDSLFDENGPWNAIKMKKVL